MPLQSDKLSRRRFLSSSVKTAAGLLTTAALPSVRAKNSRIRGANDRINVAVIGIRNQGGLHAQNFAKIENVRVKTLCDIDENLFAGRVKEIELIQGAAPSVQTDLRRVLEDKDIDAVSIVTPNHWHALATIWACQAGKDVYVEKPSCHNIREGRKAIEAAKKYNRIVAVGLQNRSIRKIRSAVKFLHNGGIGDIYMARVICFNRRKPIGRFPDGPSPDDGGQYPLYGYIQGEPRPYSSSYLGKVDYDMWLGPAPRKPFNRNRFHYNWHWYWDYGNGDIGNTSPHQFDIAAWALKKTDCPAKIHSTGGYFAFDSSQETPNFQTSVFEYPDGVVIESEVRDICTNSESDLVIGNFFYGSKGWMSLGRGKWQTFFGRENQPGPTSDNIDEYIDPVKLTGTGGSAHFENFINAVRTKNPNALTCDIEAGFMSSALPHLANISYRLRREVRFDPIRKKFISDPQADIMLTRDYRSPYVVPENI